MKKLIILDFSTSEVHVYPYDENVWECAEDFTDYDGNFVPDVHIVLAEMNNHYFYDNYEGYKIAYNVWESTRQPESFFNKFIDTTVKIEYIADGANGIIYKLVSSGIESGYTYTEPSLYGKPVKEIVLKLVILNLIQLKVVNA